MMQVRHELAFLDVIILKITKLKKIHSMAMAYKTEFEHVKGRDNKRKKQWSKSKYLHKCNVKHLKTVMQSDKHKSAVKHKHSKLNTHSTRPIESSTSATAKCVNKKKLFVKHDKKKPLDLKSNKKEGTKHKCRDLISKSIKRSMKLKTILLAKCGHTIVNMMKNDEAEEGFICSLLFLFVSTVLCPITGNYVNWKLLYGLHDILQLHNVRREFVAPKYL